MKNLQELQCLTAVDSRSFHNCGSACCFIYSIQAIHQFKHTTPKRVVLLAQPRWADEPSLTEWSQVGSLYGKVPPLNFPASQSICSPEHLEKANLFLLHCPSLLRPGLFLSLRQDYVMFLSQ